MLAQLAKYSAFAALSIARRVVALAMVSRIGSVESLSKKAQASSARAEFPEKLNGDTKNTARAFAASRPDTVVVFSDSVVESNRRPSNIDVTLAQNASMADSGTPGYEV